MLSVLGFLVALMPLVVFHEFGHFIFARIFGVKAETFSVGFGKKLWRKQIGETEWCLSAIPLGGYVKLLGEDGERQLTAEEQERSLNRAALWKRFFIFVGGPLFNFILSIFLFMAILLIGEPQMTSRLGRVVPGTAAARAGLQSGDRVVGIDGKPVRKFEEVLSAILENPGKPLTLSVQRGAADSAPVEVRVQPTSQDGYSAYGEATHVGELEGLLPMARSTSLGISDPSSLGAKAGLKTGDSIRSVGGKVVTTWEEIEAAYSALSPGQSLSLVASSKGEEKSVEVKRVAGQTLAQASGIHSSEFFVDKPVEGSPAQAAGVLPGDRLIGVGTHVVQSFIELRDAVQRSGEQQGKVNLVWERDGKTMQAEIVPTATNSRDPNLKKTTQFTVGVVPQLVWAEAETLVERVYNPITLVATATQRMWQHSERNLVSIGKMLKGEVSVKALGGPILIGKVAGESLSRGLIAFLTTMSVLSVGLGVLNLLPVPVLDGGHIVLLGMEAILRRPLSVRFVEVAQQVGFALILLLMVVVMRNDISRLPIFGN